MSSSLRAARRRPRAWWRAAPSTFAPPHARSHTRGVASSPAWPREAAAEAGRALVRAKRNGAENKIAIARAVPAALGRFFLRPAHAPSGGGGGGEEAEGDAARAAREEAEAYAVQASLLAGSGHALAAESLAEEARRVRVRMGGGGGRARCTITRPP